MGGDDNTLLFKSFFQQLQNLIAVHACYLFRKFVIDIFTFKNRKYEFS